MFHVARRIVPSARGGKEICTGRTLLVGWPFAATPVSGSCFAFFATDCEPSASEGASVVATLRLGGILTGGRRERRANIIRGRVSLWGHAFMLWVHIYGCLFGGEHVHARQSNCRTSSVCSASPSLSFTRLHSLLTYATPCPPSESSPRVSCPTTSPCQSILSPSTRRPIKYRVGSPAKRARCDTLAS